MNVRVNQYLGNKYIKSDAIAMTSSGKSKSEIKREMRLLNTVSFPQIFGQFFKVQIETRLHSFDDVHE
jgi:hypothetical protein